MHPPFVSAIQNHPGTCRSGYVVGRCLDDKSEPRFRPGGPRRSLPGRFAALYSQYSLLNAFRHDKRTTSVEITWAKVRSATWASRARGRGWCKSGSRRPSRAPDRGAIRGLRHLAMLLSPLRGCGFTAAESLGLGRKSCHDAPLAEEKYRKWLAQEKK